LIVQRIGSLMLGSVATFFARGTPGGRSWRRFIGAYTSRRWRRLSVSAPNVIPWLDPGTRCTPVSNYLSMIYSRTDGRIMSGHDDAGKAASVSMLTPAGITLRPILVADCPKMIVGKLHAVRGIYFPELAR
jgi:hypothetical protein